MATPTVIDSKRLFQAAITAAAVTVYTVPAARVTCVMTMDIANTGAADRRVRIFLVPFGGTAGVGNAIIYDTLVGGSGGTLSWTGPQFLAVGDMIAVQASDTGLTITGSGQEYT
jgi:hypothetical protein